MKLSDATEKRLLGAIKSSAEHVAAGLSPSAAIAKAAVAHGVGPGSIDTMVHAYNTGCTNQQRREGETLFDKIADFPLADAAEVRTLMYPEQPKTAAARHFDAGISAEYSRPPTALLERRQSREKAAQQINWQMCPPPPDLPTDPVARVKRAAGTVERLQTAVEEARRLARSSFDKAANLFEGLADTFRRSDAVPLPVFRANVVLMHGPVGGSVVDHLTAAMPSLMKIGSHRLGGSMIGPSGPSSFDRAAAAPATGPAYVKLASLLTQLGDYKAKQAAYEALATKNARAAEELLRPFAVPAASPSVLGPSSTDSEKNAMNIMQGLGYGALMNATLGNMARGVKGPDETQLINKNLQSLTDPEHEGKLRGINTQAMLQDFMTADPVISGYKPDEVIDAFNEVTQLAPHAGDQRMLMQNLLRKRLQQGTLDTFDTTQVLNMEDSLRKRDLAPQAPRAFGNGSVM